jgi:hypothetical protein
MDHADCHRVFSSPSLWADSSRAARAMAEIRRRLVMPAVSLVMLVMLLVILLSRIQWRMAGMVD